MRVKVRFFVAYREIAGRSEDDIDLEEGAKVGDALKVIKYLEKDEDGQYPFTQIEYAEVTRKEKWEVHGL